MHLGIVFLPILVDFGSHDGRQHRTHIDQKRYRKNDRKKKGSKRANETLLEPTTPRATSPLGPGRGGRGRGQDNSSHKGGGPFPPAHPTHKLRSLGKQQEAHLKALHSNTSGTNKKNPIQGRGDTPSDRGAKHQLKID